MRNEATVVMEIGNELVTIDAQGRELRSVLMENIPARFAKPIQKPAIITPPAPRKANRQERRAQEAKQRKAIKKFTKQMRIIQEKIHEQSDPSEVHVTNGLPSMPQQ